MRKYLRLLVLGLIGCGSVSVEENPEPVSITGKLTVAGQPVTGVKINLQPIGPGALPAVMEVQNGEFTGQASPGKYTFFISPGSDANAFAAIPEKFHSGDMERVAEVDVGSPLELKLE